MRNHEIQHETGPDGSVLAHTLSEASHGLKEVPDAPGMPPGPPGDPRGGSQGPLSAPGLPFYDMLDKT